MPPFLRAPSRDSSAACATGCRRPARCSAVMRPASSKLTLSTKSPWIELRRPDGRARTAVLRRHDLAAVIGDRRSAGGSHR